MICGRFGSVKLELKRDQAFSYSLVTMQLAGGASLLRPWFSRPGSVAERTRRAIRVMQADLTIKSHHCSDCCSAPSLCAHGQGSDFHGEKSKPQANSPSQAHLSDFAPYISGPTYAEGET